MCTWEVSAGCQKYPGDFPAGKLESLFEQLDPFGQLHFSLVDQPLIKGTMVFLQHLDLLCVVNDRFDLFAVPDDAGIAEQSVHIGLLVGSDPVNVKSIEGQLEMLPLIQNGGPAQSRLVEFHA